ncbi:MAG: hypothetical protein ACYTG7_15085, partial [Planctomycetota bacterium]
AHIEGSFEKVTLDALAGAAGAGKGGATKLATEPFRFRLTQEERKKWIDRIKKADGPIRCQNPYELAQYMMLQRQGSWQVAFTREPVMAFSEAMRARSGRV